MSSRADGRCHDSPDPIRSWLSSFFGQFPDVPVHVATTGTLVACLVVLTALVAIINRGGIGRAFAAIRQDYTVAMSLGISINSYFRYAFALSGAIGAIGGCLLAFNTYAIEPDVFGFPLLVLNIAAVILGGRSSVAGPIVGTLFLMVLPELARPLADERLLIQGIVLIVVNLPQGIVDTLVHRWAARHRLGRPNAS